MNEELLQRTMNLFDSPDKWMAFCELYQNSNDIQNRWWKKLQAVVYGKEHQQNSEWDITIYGAWDIVWFIKGESNNSFRVHFCGDWLQIEYDYLDRDHVNSLPKEIQQAVYDCFERIDGYANANAYETGNYNFGTEMDGHFPGGFYLAWFAGNKTEEFADQIIKKVRRFQTPEITALFKEINEKCKR